MMQRTCRAGNRQPRGHRAAAWLLVTVLGFALSASGTAAAGAQEPLASRTGFGLAKVADLPISKRGGRVDQVVPLDDGWLIRDTDYWNEREQRLEHYDARGRMVKVIGEFGPLPGQYYRLKDAEIASDGMVWVADVAGRLSRFDVAHGELIDTQLVQRPGYQVYDLAIDPERGFFYLTGCLPKKTYLDLGCSLVHRYRLADRKYVDSFVATDPEAVEKRLLPLEDYLVDVADDGDLYFVDAPVFKVFRVDPLLGLVDELPVASRIARPAPILSAGDGIQENRRKSAEAYLFDRVVVVDDCVVVSIRRPERVGRYLLAALDAETGAQVATDRRSPGRLVGTTADGNLLFDRFEGGVHHLEEHRVTSCQATATVAAEAGAAETSTEAGS